MRLLCWRLCIYVPRLHWFSASLLAAWSRHISVLSTVCHETHSLRRIIIVAITHIALPSSKYEQKLMRNRGPRAFGQITRFTTSSWQMWNKQLYWSLSAKKKKKTIKFVRKCPWNRNYWNHNWLQIHSILSSFLVNTDLAICSNLLFRAWKICFSSWKRVKYYLRYACDLQIHSLFTEHKSHTTPSVDMYKYIVRLYIYFTSISKRWRCETNAAKALVAQLYNSFSTFQP